ncbi:hypothetical protein [Candidatus Nitronereus thalassa]|uniref:Uncharacterized protein n=1 Tax=Candidatus Nitronereus thalassa TaxID=3020898 RepID=A0ABU3K4B2_9BACT|nr:hypothetical protein [Candidatus Nitronereus thalassa]MDT7041210.1 hypothetical protein [Candidatus Nitronereus thalassa]
MVEQHNIVDMPTEPLSEEQVSRLLSDPQPLTAYGCSMNTIQVSDLFDRYRDLGFLYPEKMRLLQPHISRVADNWERLQQAGERLIRIGTYESSGQRFASGVAWRSTTQGWVFQHLVSNSPLASCCMGLYGLANVMRDEDIHSIQVWFRPTNKYMSKVYGSFVSADPKTAAMPSYTLLAVPISSLRDHGRSHDVNFYDQSDKELLRALVYQTRGALFWQAEAFDADDVVLDRVDAQYRMVGLRRYRQVLVLHDHKRSAIQGAALMYRAPLGLNFSFLENRCDLLIDPHLGVVESNRVSLALLQRVAECLSDDELAFLPVTVDAKQAKLFRPEQLLRVQEYNQFIVVREAFTRFYHHLAQRYEPIVQAELEMDAS